MENTEVIEPSQPAAKTAWLSPAAVQLQTEPETAADPPADLPETPPAPPSQPSPPARWYHRYGKRQIILGLAATSAVFLFVVVGIAFYFRTHSFVAVQVANLQPTYAVNDPQIASQLAASIKTYHLVLQTPDGKHESYTLADMGLTPDIPATLAQAKGQHGLAFWHVTHIPLVIKSDPIAYATFLQTHARLATTPATNAALVLTNGSVTVTKETDGKGYRVADATHTVLASAASLSAQPLKLTAGTIAPDIRSSALATPKKTLSDILAQKIVFSVGPDKKQATPSDIAGWLTLTPNPAKGTVDIATNTDAVTAYVDALASPYLMAPADTVTPAGSDGTITIVEQRSGGSVQAESTLTADLAKKVVSASGGDVQVTISGKAARTVTAVAQPKWLLVNTSTKRMYAYEDTKLVRTFLISSGAAATPTVLGTFKIYAKYPSQDMRGANADGTNYFQPNVQYVNYFYKDYAVHGNYWRPLSYFGNINSSHGCVGIVNSDASWVYSWAPIGTTVIVHN